MNYDKYTLIKVAEECNEVIRELTDVAERCFKAAVFGLDETQRDQDLDNRQRLENEITDLYGTIQVLVERKLISDIYNPLKYQAKKEKLEKYYEKRDKNT